MSRWEATASQAEIAMAVFEGDDWRNCRDADEADELLEGMRVTLTEALTDEITTAIALRDEETRTVKMIEKVCIEHGMPESDDVDIIEWLDDHLEVRS